MGPKKNKSKKVVPQPQYVEPPPVANNDEDDLMDDLFSQLDSKNQTVQAESAAVINEINLNTVVDETEVKGKQDSKSRHKARMARKAAALAEKFAPSDTEADARLQREAEEEEKSIKRTCEELGVRMFEISPDGHCLFSAVADQLNILGILPNANYAAVRRTAADYIHLHPDDFIPFLPSTAGEDTLGATSDTGLMGPAEFAQYCRVMRDTGAWGGEPEILALSRAYNIPIHVIQGGSPSIVVHEPLGSPHGISPTEKVVRISYHRRMYGLGEHYNSLRPKSIGNGVVDNIKSVFGQ